MTQNQEQRLKELAKDLPRLMSVQNMNLLNEYRKLVELQHRENYEATGICNHEISQGDSNGESCKICNKQLRGYGFGGTGKKCLHHFLRLETSNMGMCQYCEFIYPDFITN